MPWIAPELREDNGEIEAALSGQLPRLIEQRDLRGDLHCHTHWTDGSASLEDMAVAARARGYAYMALTDHSRSLTITNGLSLERLEEARRLVQQLNHQLAPFVILLGTEMDILEDGRLDYPDDVLATLDYVSASVHSRFKQTEALMTPRILRAVTHPLVHTLNHPHGRLLGARPAYAVDMPSVIDAAARAGCALEVSADPARMDLDGPWARRARQSGARCTISSDAHSTLDYDNIWLGIGSARRGWLEAADVLNTRPLDELRALLQSRSS
jgi:DNA polymerase (family 10)